MQLSNKTTKTDQNETIIWTRLEFLFWDQLMKSFQQCLILRKDIHNLQESIQILYGHWKN